MRLFVAIAPDRQAEAQLGRRLMDVQAAIGEQAPRLKWTPASNVHITLQFLGEIRDADLRRVVEALGRTVDEAPFDVAIGGVGTFPSAGAPRVVWLDIVGGTAPLARVRDAIGERLEPAGFPRDTRPFSPHVTIARVPDRERAHVKGLRDRVQQFNDDERRAGDAPITWMAERVILFRSDLSGSVPRYEGLHDIELATVG